MRIRLAAVSAVKGWEVVGAVNKGDVLWDCDVNSVEKIFWSPDIRSKCGKLTIGIAGRLGAEHACKEFQNSPEEIIVLVENEESGLPGKNMKLDHLPAI